MAMIDVDDVMISNEEVSVNKVLDNLLFGFENYNVEKRVVLRVSKTLQDNDSYIRTDLVKFQQILTNLISNALKFTDEGIVEIGYTLKGYLIEFFVKDTGIGIDEKFHEIIFERFGRAEHPKSRLYGGTGLGLSISKAFVEKLGGKIWLISKLGEGSAFYFTLPYNKVEKVNKTILKPEQKVTIDKKLEILIVEDDEASYLFLKEILRGLTSEILHAKSGREAIDIAIKRKGINIILMDLGLPDINGYQATEEILSHRTNVSIIAQTAFTSIYEREKALKSGCIGYITKPINISKLLSVINKHALEIKK
jgi:hypothetical protein